MNGIKEISHLVINHQDIRDYLSQKEVKALNDILCVIIEGRKKDGKSINDSYYIVNKDEPYASTVLDVILEGEGAKVKGGDNEV